MEIPYIDAAATGRNIDRLRTEACLSVKDIQAVFGFTTPQAVYKWIHGAALPSIDNLVILAAILDVTRDHAIDSMDAGNLNHVNGSYKQGEELAMKQLGEGDLLIKKEFASNEHFYLNAQEAAISTIQCLIRQLNPNVENLTIDVEFY